MWQMSEICIESSVFYFLNSFGTNSVLSTEHLTFIYLLIRIVWSIVSKAFDKPTNEAVVILLVSSASTKSAYISITACIVDRLALNPYCLSDNLFLTKLY